MHAPRCCRTGKSSHHVRVRSGALVPLVLAGRGAGIPETNPRVAQSISRGTFDNALRAQEPTRQRGRACLLPPVGYRGKPPLLSPALKTEPSAAVFARDFDVSAEWVPSPLRRDSPVGNAFVLASAYRHRSTGRGAAINPAPFGGGWGHQPHFPPPAVRIDKGPITHPPPNLAVSASRPELTSFGFADEVPKSSQFVTELRFLFGNVRIFFERISRFDALSINHFDGRTRVAKRISVDRAFAPCRDDRS
jgi:hypothetical protein